MKVILGGGVAGLIAALYLEDYRIITMDIGGQFFGEFTLGPRLIKDTLETQRLVRKVYPDETILKRKLIKVGYMDKDGAVHATPGKGMLKHYAKKTRGKKKCSQVLMSEGENEIMTLNYPNLFFDIIQIVVDRIFSNCWINRISDNVLHLGLSKSLPQFVGIDKGSINTLPLPKFTEGLKLKWKPTYFYQVTDLPLWNKLRLGNEDYLYLPTRKYLGYRITRSSKVGEIIIESHIDNTDIRRLYPNSYKADIRERKSISFGRIMNEDKNYLGLGNMHLLGRYAQWNPDIRISDIIQRVEGIYNAIG